MKDENREVYALFFSKKDKVINVGSAKRLIIADVGEEPVQYNDCYYVGTNKKLLKDLAIKLKQKWIDEIEAELELLKKIDINK